MSDLVPEPRLRRRDGVLAKEAQGRTVLLRLDDGSYYALDGVGGRIWELCDGTRSLDDIVSALGDEFHVSAASATVDVREFVGELERDGLLVDASR